MSLRRCNLFLLFMACFFVCGAGEAFGRLADLMIEAKGKMQQAKITSALVEAQLDETAMLVTYDLKFYNPTSVTKEGTFYFNLPRESYVHDFGFYVRDKYQSAAVVERMQGRKAYETIVRRGIDPALAEWTAGDAFKLKVFPIFATSDVRVKMTISLKPQINNGRVVFDIPMDLEGVTKGDFKIKGDVGFPTKFALEGARCQLDNKITNERTEISSSCDLERIGGKDLRLSFADDFGKGIRFRAERTGNDRFFEARMSLKLPKIKRKSPTRLVVLWDHSLSGEEQHGERLRVLKEYFDTFTPKAVELISFRDTARYIQVKVPSYNELKKAIEREAYDGATRIEDALVVLDKILKNTKKQSADILTFTDGMDTFRMLDSSFKSLALGSLHQSILIVPTVNTDSAILGRLANVLKAVMIPLTELNLKDAFQNQAFVINRLQVNGVDGQNLVTSIRGAVSPGQGVLLYGTDQKSSGFEVALSVVGGGKKYSKTWKVQDKDVAKASGQSVARRFAYEKIQNLIPQKDQHKKEILNTAIQHKLLSPYTVMVVLEFCEDYREFKLKAPKDCPKRPSYDEYEDEDYADDYDEGIAAEDDEMVDYDEGYEEGGDYAGGSSFSSSPRTIDFDAVDIGGNRKTPFGSMIPSPDAAPPPMDAAEGDLEEIIAEIDEEGDYNDYGDDYLSYEESVRYPFLSSTYSALSKLLPEKSAQKPVYMNQVKPGTAKSIYSSYLYHRKQYQRDPHFFQYVSELLWLAKDKGLSNLVLSNLMETKPGEARWLRVFAYENLNRGQASNAVLALRGVMEMREEDAQTWHDMGRALELMGEHWAAYQMYEKTMKGKWDWRMNGFRKLAKTDVVRSALNVGRSQKFSKSIKSKVQKYTKNSSRLARALPAMEISAVWDADGNDVDLHVIEPTATHTYSENPRPKDSPGRILFSNHSGVGPETYVNVKPYKGKYKVMVSLVDSRAISYLQRTNVRVDFRIRENGIEKKFHRFVSLGSNGDMSSVLEFTYNDRKSTVAPETFEQMVLNAKDLLSKKKYKTALSKLAKSPRKDKKEEARRYFHLARAYAGLKQFDKAEMMNQKALALNPKLLAAHYNNACFASLAKNKSKAMHYLDLLVISLKSSPRRESLRFEKLMQTDTDLNYVRQTAEFRRAFGSIKKMAH